MRSSGKLAVVIGLLVLVGVIVVIALKLPARKEVEQPVAPKKPDVTARKEPKRKPPERPTPPRPAPAKPTPAPAARIDDETVLATVNSVPLTAGDVFGPRGLEMLMSLPTTDRESLRARLDQAIEEELLRQYAAETGLDERPEYKKAGAREKHRLKQIETRQLAILYESRNEELVALAKSIQPTDAEVERYYQENRERYAQSAPEKARESVRGTLLAQRHTQAYAKWLERTVPQVRITVNGHPIPVELLKAGLDSVPPESNVPGMGTPSEFPAGEALFAFVREAAGAKDNSDASRKLLLETEIQVGNDVFKISDFFGGLAREGPPVTETAWQVIEGMLQSPMLITSLKTRVMAHKAKQEGMDKSPEFHDPGRPPLRDPRLQRSGPSPEAVLAEMVWEQADLVSPQNIQISEGEIDAHINENEAQYRSLMKRTGGENRARTAARRRIAFEKLRQMRKDFIRELWDAADIKILVDRFK